MTTVKNPNIATHGCYQCYLYCDICTWLFILKNNGLFFMIFQDNGLLLTVVFGNDGPLLIDNQQIEIVGYMDSLLFRNGGLSKPRVDQGASRVACRHQRTVSCIMTKMMIMTVVMMVMMMKMIDDNEYQYAGVLSATSSRRSLHLLSEELPVYGGCEHCCHH